MPKNKIKGWYVAELDLLTTAHLAFQKRFPIREGETLTLSECVIPRVCEVGYHACERLLHALSYRSEGIITLVVAYGDVAYGDDQVAGRSRKTLRIVPKDIADRECRLFAADVAERLLLAERQAGREPSPEAFAAVEVARRFALGDADETERTEGQQAAWSAVVAAEEAAREVAVESAAYATLWSVAYAAAVQTAWSVAEGRAMATRAEEMVKLSLELEDRLLKAIGEEP